MSGRLPTEDDLVAYARWMADMRLRALTRPWHEPAMPAIEPGHKFAGLRIKSVKEPHFAHVVGQSASIHNRRHNFVAAAMARENDFPEREVFFLQG